MKILISIGELAPKHKDYIGYEAFSFYLGGKPFQVIGSKARLHDIMTLNSLSCWNSLMWDYFYG